ncbi:MAG: hypothetical protein QOJ65_1884 [Fimbriimonadaceae bacterium]|jgi:hypothetical protein|nr:hypothetical protein [Fimbriimonadaceae bacterium]
MKLLVLTTLLGIAALSQSQDTKPGGVHAEEQKQGQAHCPL